MIRRDELRQPLRRRGAWERLWAKRPSALFATSLAAALSLVSLALWLALTPYPFAGEPIVTVDIPPVKVEDLATASIDKPAPSPVKVEAEEPDAQLADEDPALQTESEEPEEPLDKLERRKVEIIESSAQETVETDSAIIVSPRRSLKPAPFAEVSERGPYGALPRIGSGNRKPQNVYARTVSAGIVHSDMPKIAILLGGMGLNAELTRRAMRALPGEVTFAFAPYGEDLQAEVNRARAAGHEIMLQLPLEPFGYPAANPGPKTLMTSAEAGANLDALAWHMGRFSGYTGIVNYMGAKFLNDPGALRPVLAEMKKRGLLFLDDGASKRSMVAEIGKIVGLPVEKGTKIIDAEPDSQKIEAALSELEAQARASGFAIGTGTGLDVTIEAVEEWSRSLAGKGILLVPVSSAYGGRAG